jgi:hypothetical protein
VAFAAIALAGIQMSDATAGSNSSGGPWSVQRCSFTGAHTTGGGVASGITDGADGNCQETYIRLRYCGPKGGIYETQWYFSTGDAAISYNGQALASRHEAKDLFSGSTSYTNEPHQWEVYCV